MKGVLILCFHVLVLSFQAKAWHAVRNPFEFVKPPEKIHPVTDCMQVTSEDGEFVFRKVAPVVSAPKHGRLIDILGSAPSMEVCGLYFVTDPDKIVEVSVKHLDVNCDTGGLMSFVDGWELNGMYFPTEQDHPKGMEQRVEEFCNDPKLWPYSPVRKAFRSSQNAALVQYRIPISGSFVVSVRYLRNPDPCNVMAEGVAPYYTLRNHGKHRNCTLTAVFPAVISLVGIDVGGRKDGVNYDCDRPDSTDRLDIGGSPGLDSSDMDKSAAVCGKSLDAGPEQAIFCEASSVRLVSSGRHANQAMVSVRMADENDIPLATVLCDMRRKKKK
ncbi:corticotropin-releasing factor-binding protein [Culex quinquefasciatus]|uniref:Corticotropin-releasing factor-binding protein n=1 Tax=Culex pipiens TaxID=7175 RepID=A0A8D8AFL6_CULPI|nr:corticotropin-releasing factor-binding protein [Culex quinquefasciatus]XP_038122573.1 corticotropin-releasing factor-binding protein [Culex quinquefasciatus]XP_038122574.1 corticotropin-releasing factor-binding protein [Culex quinquefasciatus]XP_039434080.1 corticotropin-releasing factor-binding protein [Culex pipiens pallens]